MNTASFEPDDRDKSDASNDTAKNGGNSNFENASDAEFEIKEKTPESNSSQSTEALEGELVEESNESLLDSQSSVSSPGQDNSAENDNTLGQLVVNPSATGSGALSTNVSPSQRMFSGDSGGNLTIAVAKDDQFTAALSQTLAFKLGTEDPKEAAQQALLWLSSGTVDQASEAANKLQAAFQDLIQEIDVRAAHAEDPDQVSHAIGGALVYLVVIMSAVQHAATRGEDYRTKVSPIFEEMMNLVTTIPGICDGGPLVRDLPNLLKGMRDGGSIGERITNFGRLFECFCDTASTARSRDDFYAAFSVLLFQEFSAVIQSKETPSGLKREIFDVCAKQVVAEDKLGSGSTENGENIPVMPFSRIVTASDLVGHRFFLAVQNAFISSNTTDGEVSKGEEPIAPDAAASLLGLGCAITKTETYDRLLSVVRQESLEPEIGATLLIALRHGLNLAAGKESDASLAERQDVETIFTTALRILPAATDGLQMRLAKRVLFPLGTPLLAYLSANQGERYAELSPSARSSVLHQALIPLVEGDAALSGQLVSIVKQELIAEECQLSSARDLKILLPETTLDELDGKQRDALVAVFVPQYPSAQRAVEKPLKESSSVSSNRRDAFSANEIDFQEVESLPESDGEYTLAPSSSADIDEEMVEGENTEKHLPPTKELIESYNELTRVLTACGFHTVCESYRLAGTLDGEEDLGEYIEIAAIAAASNRCRSDESKKTDAEVLKRLVNEMARTRLDTAIEKRLEILAEIKHTFEKQNIAEMIVFDTARERADYDLDAKYAVMQSPGFTIYEKQKDALAKAKSKSSSARAQLDQGPSRSRRKELEAELATAQKTIENIYGPKYEKEYRDELEGLGEPKWKWNFSECERVEAQYVELTRKIEEQEEMIRFLTRKLTELAEDLDTSRVEVLKRSRALELFLQCPSLTDDAVRKYLENEVPGTDLYYDRLKFIVGSRREEIDVGETEEDLDTRIRRSLRIPERSGDAESILEAVAMLAREESFLPATVEESKLFGRMWRSFNEFGKDYAVPAQTENTPEAEREAEWFQQKAELSVKFFTTLTPHLPPSRNARAKQWLRTVISGWSSHYHKRENEALSYEVMTRATKSYIETTHGRENTLEKSSLMYDAYYKIAHAGYLLKDDFEESFIGDELVPLFEMLAEVLPNDHPKPDDLQSGVKNQPAKERIVEMLEKIRELAPEKISVDVEDGDSAVKLEFNWGKTGGVQALAFNPLVRPEQLRLSNSLPEEKDTRENDSGKRCKKDTQNP